MKHDDPTALPAAKPRRLLHERSIKCDGYLRDDGLWEVEAHLCDTKTFDYIEPVRGPLEAGGAIHDMALRLTFDDDLIIVDAAAAMAATPMLACRDVRLHIAKVKGVKVGAGWRKEVKERIGRRDSCTHLMDLMAPAITTLYQTMGMGKDPDGCNSLDRLWATGERPHFLDGCHGWRLDGNAVRTLFSDWATPSGGAAGQSPQEPP